MWGGGVLLWWQPEVGDICGEEEYYYGGNQRLMAYVGRRSIIMVATRGW